MKTLQMVLERLSAVDDWALATGMVLFILGMLVLLAAVTFIDSAVQRHGRRSRAVLSRQNITRRRKK